MCEKQISTENGILTCELAKGHSGFHKAGHPGGLVPMIDRQKAPAGTDTPFKDEHGVSLAVHTVDPLYIEWPQETEPVHVKIAKERPRGGKP